MKRSYLEKIGISILGDRKKIIKILHGFTEELFEIPQSDILSINGNQVPRDKIIPVKNKNKIIIGNSIGIITFIFFVLSCHIIIGYGNGGIKIFARDHLTLENTIITSDTVYKLITKYNNENFYEKVQMQAEPLLKKLMDEGIIYREK
jgi:hypothetical protein